MENILKNDLSTIHIIFNINSDSIMKKLNEVKVLFIGDSGVGKTSLLHSFVDQKFTQSHKATIGADIVLKTVFHEGKEITLQIWDTAGQETFNSMGNMFYRGTDCCIIVYDITNSKTFQHVQKWRQSFVNQGRIQNPEKFPLFMVGNKIDRQSQRMVFDETVNTYLEDHSYIKHYETSARNLMGTLDILKQIGKVGYEYRKSQEEIYHPELNTIKIGEKRNKKPRKGKSCGSCN